MNRLMNRSGVAAASALGLALLSGFVAAPAREADTPPHSAEDYAADAMALAGLIHDAYAYLDELPGGDVPSSAQLDAERDAVRDRDGLLHYAEDLIAALADHHALTASSFRDDWAVVPSYSDIWITRSGDAYRVDAVKDDSIAAAAGIRSGDRLVQVDGQPIDTAVSSFWSRLGLTPDGERGPYAARVLAAGRRDRQRVLTFATPAGERTFTLDSLYAHQVDQPALTVEATGGVTTIRFNNSIGEQSTIAAFDAEMAKLPPDSSVVIDLTDTPSGGNTTVARAIMGWFVTRPMPYQMHQLPGEARATGIERRWVEYVLPRAGKYHPGPVQIRVGRWTGSMGEGLAVGFMALGYPVCGTPMAGLKGAVYDLDLPNTGLGVKFPVEQLFTVDGTPRHHVVPEACRP